MSGEGEGSGRSVALDRALAIAAVMVPIATAIVAGIYANATAKRDAGVKLTELAISILRSPATPASGGLRGWAIKVVNRYSADDIPADVSEALIRSLSLPASSTPLGVTYEAPQGGLEVSASGMVKMLKVGRWPLVACAPSRLRMLCDTAWVTVTPEMVKADSAD